MAMVCSQCAAGYEQCLECPNCDGCLDFKERRGASRPVGLSGWQHTAWGRIVIGLVLAQGLFHCVRHLAVAVLLAVPDLDQQGLWGTSGGFVLLQAMQIFGLVIGCLLAGAGQRQGAVYGAILGVWNGVLVVVMQPDTVEYFNSLAMIGLPMFQAGVGTLAGWLGGRIWPPLTTMGAGGARQPLKSAKRETTKWFFGPIHYVRVVLGTSLAVAGALSASVVLERVERISEYQLSAASVEHTRLVTWEIVTLAIVAGGALAGATTRNGLMQGLAVGISTSIILLGIRISSPNPPSYLLLAFSMIGPVILAIIGGGFGSQLLPPLPSARVRSREMP